MDESSLTSLLKQELVDDRSKRRSTEEEEQHLSQSVGSYLVQSSAGSIVSSHSPIPATYLMVTNPNSQIVSGGESMWTFPSNSNMYRGSMSMSSGGLHFLNFPTPMALLSQQGGIGGGSGGNIMNESHLSMLAALNAYRNMPSSAPAESSPGSTSHHHGGGSGGGDDHHHHHHHHHHHEQH